MIIVCTHTLTTYRPQDFSCNLVWTLCHRGLTTQNLHLLTSLVNTNVPDTLQVVTWTGDTVITDNTLRMAIDSNIVNIKGTIFISGLINTNFSLFTHLHFFKLKLNLCGIPYSI
jgi:hypothetical protein